MSQIPQDDHVQAAALRLGRTQPFGVKALQAHRIEDILAGASGLGLRVYQADLASLPCTLAAAERQVAEWLNLPPLDVRRRGVLLDQLTGELFDRARASGYLFLLKNVPVEKTHAEVRDEILEYFSDAAEYWRQLGIPFRCFHSAGTPRSAEDRASALRLVSPFSMGLPAPAGGSFGR
ncbi:hypothetical protein [Ramlibacter humi]|uniref:Uncharacterized protein n=1 Tax=Ramlibacter humi TaxID=2530451 RepID=A0A4Z0BCQ9_9BURK|nr:hypothetical protein [Ramlibacter humi]TFY97022.1 hypothetical protein EZ216_19350 [Ramlibacter humi]